MRKGFGAAQLSIAVLAMVLAAGAARARESKNFGIGFVLGDPTALSAKLWTSPNTALDFALAWGWGNYYGPYYGGDYPGSCEDPVYRHDHPDRCYGYYYNRYDGNFLHFHLDYLFHNFDVIRSSERLPIYYGPGLAVNHYYNYDNASWTDFGIRGVIGIAWMPHNAPLDIFLELAPVLNLFPGVGPYINGGLGARFYF